MRSTVHTPGCPGVETGFLETVDRNRRIGSEQFDYLRCSVCGLIRIADVPQDLWKYYPQSYYAIPTRQALDHACAKDRTKIETVKRFVSNGRVLEIGPAYGTFALQALRAGFDVDAIEMDERCCRFLRSLGIRVLQSDVPEVVMKSLGDYDVIALWHVIEHVSDPWGLLEEIARHVSIDGVVVVAAPNPEAFQFRLMGSAWPHVDAPRHLYLLPRSVLTAFMAGLGFSLVLDVTTDADARNWNRFGWQRWLMNRVGRRLRRLASLAGWGLSVLMFPFEMREPSGSAYTLVFRKS